MAATNLDHCSLIDLLIQQKNFFCLEPLVHSIPAVANYVNREDKLLILGDHKSSMVDFYCTYYHWINEQLEKSSIEDACKLASFIKHPHAMYEYIKTICKLILEDESLNKGIFDGIDLVIFLHATS